MKFIFNYTLLLIFIILPVFTYPQDFTKITEGDIVNEGGQSFGVAWIDFDNDGDVDLFVANGGAAGVSQLNFFYENNGDGTFIKINDDPIGTLAGISIGSTWADADNDGYIDLFIANRDNENNFFIKNNGDISFEFLSSSILSADGGNSNGSSWSDFDNDGDVDLFVANFFQSNSLYINSGDGTFEKSGPGIPFVDDVSTSIGGTWSDYDSDGDIDFYLVNASSAGTENFLYVNDESGNYVKQSNSIIATDKGATLGATFGDYDNDGDFDLFIANNNNSVNFLYKNEGGGSFTKITEGSVVTDIAWSVSGSWIDIDNDGDLDLYVSNWNLQKNSLYVNSGFPDYELTKAENNPLVEDINNSMGHAWADMDNDGDLDLFVANRDNQNNLLFRNETNGNSWINIKLEGTNSNRAAIGVKVKIKANIKGNDFWQLREVSSQIGYNGQNSLRAHFGLADAVVVDSIIAEWPSGTVDIFTDIDANQFVKITESESTITDVDKPNEIITKFNLTQNYPNPFNPTTIISYNIPSLETRHGVSVQLKVYDILGNEISTLVNEQMPSGNYSVQFDASKLSSGIYFYTLQAGSFINSKKMILLK